MSTLATFAFGPSAPVMSTFAVLTASVPAKSGDRPESVHEPPPCTVSVPAPSSAPAKEPLARLRRAEKPFRSNATSASVETSDPTVKSLSAVSRAPLRSVTSHPAFAPIPFFITAATPSSVSEPLAYDPCHAPEM